MSISGPTQKAIWGSYREHRRGLFAVAYAITGVVEMAEDAVHDATVAVAKGTGVPRDFKAYLFRAVRNEALRSLRRARSNERLSHDYVPQFLLTASEDRPDLQAIAREEAAALEQALFAIGSDEREIIVLRIYAGLPFREIAELLDVPLPTAASRYRRGIERMADELKEASHAAP